MILGSHEGQPPPRKRSKEGSSTSGSRGGNKRGIRARGGQARGTGRVKTGGRRVRSSTATSTTGEIEVVEQPHLTFDDPDQNMNILFPFTPRRPTGIHFEGPVLHNRMTTELDIFRLFITPAMVSAIVRHTDTYAIIKVGTRGYTKAYVDREGFWTSTRE